MAFSDRLPDLGTDVWTAQQDHPFVRELPAGTPDEAAFRHWVEQDYRYPLDYARLFALAGVEAEDAKRALCEVLETVTDEGADYFQRSFDAIDCEVACFEAADGPGEGA